MELGGPAAEVVGSGCAFAALMQDGTVRRGDVETA